MLLLEWAFWLKTKGHLQNLRVVTVHHKTRTGQNEDVALVVQRANFLGLESIIVEREEGGASDELSLREFRHQKLLGLIGSHEDLWMAHHLDDSWEWAQLQMSRSSETKSVLGIPLKHGPIVRPFLCVTKNQILRLAKKISLTWREDPTNSLPNYGRFLFRQDFALKLKKEHPQYLKHYAYRSQRLAEGWGLALRKTQTYQIYRSAIGTLIEGNCGEQVLIDEIKKISRSTRGSLHREVQKILLALRNNKRGPFTLSGEVKVSLYSGWLWLYHQDFSPPAFPEVIEFENLTKAQFEQRLRKAFKSNLNWTPFWVIFNPLEKNQNTLVLESKDALWASIPENRCVISGFKLLKRWKDPQQILSLALPW